MCLFGLLLLLLWLSLVVVDVVVIADVAVVGCLLVVGCWLLADRR